VNDKSVYIEIWYQRQC